MPRLIIKTAGLENRTLELRLGVNRIGRDSNCDFCISHPTLSGVHCEIEVSAAGVQLRDCDSTNGVFLDNNPVKEARLVRGQKLRLGDVEFLVESTEVNVAIPEFDRGNLKRAAVLEGGAIACARHSREPATYRCTHCHDLMCNHCVRIMNIEGGRPLFLCPLCSSKCEPVIGITAPEKKKGFFASLADTVKLKFIIPPRDKK